MIAPHGVEGNVITLDKSEATRRHSPVSHPGRLVSGGSLDELGTTIVTAAVDVVTAMRFRRWPVDRDGRGQRIVRAAHAAFRRGHSAFLYGHE